MKAWVVLESEYMPYDDMHRNEFFPGRNIGDQCPEWYLRFRARRVRRYPWRRRKMRRTIQDDSALRCFHSAGSNVQSW
jgi:hypothetical protein